MNRNGRGGRGGEGRGRGRGDGGGGAEGRGRGRGGGGGGAEGGMREYERRQAHRPVALQAQHFGGGGGNGGPQWRGDHPGGRGQFQYQYQSGLPPPGNKFPGAPLQAPQYAPQPHQYNSRYGQGNQYLAPHMSPPLPHMSPPLPHQQQQQQYHQQQHHQGYHQTYQQPHWQPYPQSQPPPPPNHFQPMPPPQNRPPPRPQHNYLSGNAFSARKKPSQSNRKRKKDIVQPVEQLTEEPVVRAPLNDAERKEIEAWKAERRKHWPTEANVLKKQKDLECGAGSGDSRQITLGDVLDTQQRLGLLRKAGTEDLMKQMHGEHMDVGDHGRPSGGGRRVVDRGGTAGEGKPSMRKAQGTSGRGIDLQQHRERKKTLLERLLEKDIISYESKVVQLCHFIHMNGFFRDQGKALVFPPAVRTKEDLGGGPVGGDSSGGVGCIDVDITAGEDDEDANDFTNEIDKGGRDNVEDEDDREENDEEAEESMKT